MNYVLVSDGQIEDLRLYLAPERALNRRLDYLNRVQKHRALAALGLRIKPLQPNPGVLGKVRG